MGSFNLTCGISGLPILAGMPVRWIPLAANTRGIHEGSPVYSSCWWSPRGFPVRGRYNDYGGLEKYNEEDVSIKTFKKVMQRDLVELGTGDNHYHDVPVRKDATFEQIQNALYEGRLTFTRGSYGRLGVVDGDAKHEASQLSKGVPTLRAIEKLVADINRTHLGGKGEFLFDAQEYGWIRVRHVQLYTDGAYQVVRSRLQRLADVIQSSETYAAVLTADPHGSVGDENSVQILPRPRKDLRVLWDQKTEETKKEADNERIYWHQTSTDDEKPYPVHALFIPDSVWTRLLKTPQVATEWSTIYTRPRTLDEYVERVVKYWNFRIAYDQQEDELLRKYIYRMGAENDYFEGNDMVACPTRRLSAFARYSEGRLGIGVAEHFDAAFEMRDKLTHSQLTAFFGEVAGFLYVADHLEAARHVWKPSTGYGSQLAEYPAHLKLLKVYQEAAKADSKWWDR